MTETTFTLSAYGTPADVDDYNAYLNEMYSYDVDDQPEPTEDHIMTSAERTRTVMEEYQAQLLKGTSPEYLVAQFYNAVATIKRNNIDVSDDFMIDVEVGMLLAVYKAVPKYA